MSFRLSTKGRYGVRAISRIAAEAGDQPVSIHTIAEDEQIPLRYLEQLMNKLRRSGLVSSFRGVKGGYLLTKPADKISLGEIIEALEGKVTISDCVDHNGEPPCTLKEQCQFNPFWHHLSSQIQNYLNSISLNDLIKSQWNRKESFK